MYRTDRQLRKCFYVFEPLLGRPRQLSAADELDKHAHLQFSTLDKKNVVSFVDYRRFGRWEEGADWGRDRGPDPVYEHDAFRQNVLDNLKVCIVKQECLCVTESGQKAPDILR